MQGLETFVGTYGYFAVFFGVMAQNAALPIPGETILLIAGFYSHRGHLSFWLVVLLGIMGAVTGDNISYWVGRRGGRKLLDRYSERLRLSAAKMSKVEKFFEDHGDEAVFFQRWVPVVRTIGAVVAGVSHMPWIRFLVFNILGATVWVIAISTIGYVTSGQLSALGPSFDRSGAIAMFVVFAAGVLAMVVVRLRRDGGSQQS